MEDYIGKICPFCKTEIKEGDNVKVCPICDIPHHAECWEENKGCTTFGCSGGNNQTNSETSEIVCTNCGTPLGDDQAFCPKCGAPKVVPAKKTCERCGAQLRDDQEFCSKCGQKVGFTVEESVNSAISQFNANIGKKKKVKKLPIILAVILVIVSIGGFFAFKTIQTQKVEKYMETAETFRSKVLDCGTTLEDIGNEIQDAWYAYIYAYRYHGTYYYSLNSAISAARNRMSSEISQVKSNNSEIEALYNTLQDIPDKSNEKLIEIKECVDDLYEDYQDLYDSVISPSGTYINWKSKYSRADSATANSLGDLADLLG